MTEAVLRSVACEAVRGQDELQVQPQTLSDRGQQTGTEPALPLPIYCQGGLLLHLGLFSVQVMLNF